MFNVKFIAVAAASLAAALGLLLLFLAAMLRQAQIPAASAREEESLFLVVSFLLNALLAGGLVYRARLKFQEYAIRVHALTYFFMATAFAGVIWAVSFFIWCEKYHAGEIIPRNTAGHFEIAVLGSVAGAVLLGLLAVALSGLLNRNYRPSGAGTVRAIPPPSMPPSFPAAP
jgi:hypothetical protein